MNDLISIIIPCYNVEQYIRHCLDTVINQTYKNLEIICVNDGSTDNTLKVLKEYEAKDERIIVITQENMGLSGARNTGLKVFKGKYVAFIDSDDYIALEYIEHLYKAIKDNHADMSCCNVIHVDEAGNIIEVEKRKAFAVFESNYECYRAHAKGKGITVAAWCKLMTAELVKDFEYPVGKLYEDTASIQYLLKNCNRAVVIDELLYYYVIRKSSITHRVWTSNQLDLLWAHDIRIEYITNLYPDLAVSLEKQFGGKLIATWYHMGNFSNVTKEDIRIFKAYARKYLKPSLKYSKKKWMILGFAYLPGLMITFKKIKLKIIGNK